ncbi:MAG: hypothetical protein AAF525_17665 [Pseudomonadota bacterium]
MNKPDGTREHMVDNRLLSRKERYFELSTQIARLSDKALLRKVRQTGTGDSGWGVTQVIEIGDHRIFVKRIPVTDKELMNPYSTRNHYQMPLWYNYGVGSAGFGVFREIFSHIKTTNWVLSGECTDFPMTYHHRIVRDSLPLNTLDEENEQELADYQRYWGHSKRIGQYLRDRALTRHQVLLFLEWQPLAAGPWLMRNPRRTIPVLEQMMRVTEFLQQHHVVHFDAHMMNILSDGKRSFLTDFGLVLDGEFDLNEQEHAFLAQHRQYDVGQLLHGLAWPVTMPFNNPTLKQQTIDRFRLRRISDREFRTFVVTHVAELIDSGLLKLEPRTRDWAIRYGSVIDLMESFYTDMRAGSKKNHPFPHRKLARRLKSAQT